MSQSISSNGLAFIIPGSPAESYMTWKFQDSGMISEDQAEYLWYMLLKFETVHSLWKCHYHVALSPLLLTWFDFNPGIEK